MVNDDIESEQEYKVMEFDFPVPLNKISENLTKIHVQIGKLLNIPDDDNLLNFIFTIVASLSDPFTQPEENERCLLSLDCLSDVAIALAYKKFLEYRYEDDGEVLDIHSIKFSLSTKFFTLLQHIHILLNANDELKLRYINNDEDHWIENLSKWTPHPSIANEEFNLKIIHAMACLLIMVIYKLFKPKSGTYNLIINPYLQYLIKLWKCHTNIILLALEIDRRIEFKNQENHTQDEPPELILDALRGSSSIRYVLAWVINQNPSSLYEQDNFEKSDVHNDHDIRNETLLNFVHPNERKKVNGGALSIDMRLVVIALLINSVGMSFVPGKYIEPDDDILSNPDKQDRRLNQSKEFCDLGDILIDLEYDDRFDEDIRYIFEYEYDDSEEWSDADEEKTEAELAVNSIESESNEVAVPTAVRIKSDVDNIEFDKFGRDWRDLPREQNSEFRASFLDSLSKFENLLDKEQSDDFFSSWEELYDTFAFLSINSIEGDEEAERRAGQVLINTISKAVKDEFEGKEDLIISPDKIFQYWSSAATEREIQTTQDNNKLIVPIFTITKFELFLHNNNKLARCLMDEMLMCKGYRRVLIWFITHNINLSSLLIDYVFELLAELRGNDLRQKPYEFTRLGNKVVLSEVEQSMLLHEFLTNSCIYLSATEGIEIEDGYKVVLAESIAKKYMTLMCLMINQLISLGIICLDRTNVEKEDHIHDYTNELQVLLINWMGKLPEARELFFKVKSANYDVTNYDVDVKPCIQDNSLLDIQEDYNEKDQYELIETFKSMTSTEISEHLESNDEHLKIINKFTNRIENHIISLVNSQMKESHTVEESQSDLKQISKDFGFFFNSFNTLCKVEVIAESLFNKFEPFVSTGSFEEESGDPAMIKEADEEFDFEFNDQFLNGEGKFSEKKQSKTSKKKARKKKSKKK